MADLTDVYAALKKADAAGDTEGAKQLADYIRTQSAAAPETVAEAPSKNNAPPVTTSEGMPAPRSAFEAILRHTSPAYMAVNNQFAPDYLTQAAAAAGRGALKNWGTLGGLGDIVNKPSATPGAPPEGAGYPATSQEVEQAAGLEKTPPGYQQYEVIGGMLGPGLITNGLGLAARGGRAAFEAGRNVINPTANALLAATGNKAPEIVNALRAGTPGLETAGSAAAPVGSVEFSKFAKGLEPYAAQANADIAKAKDAVLGGNAASVETTANDAAKTIASDIAAPNQSEIGKALSDTAHQTREQVKADIIRPAYDAAFKAAGNAKIDASGVVAKAEEILGKPLADIPTDAMPETAEVLSKLKSTGPTLTDSTGAVISRPKVQGTLEQLDKVRKAINNDIASAQTSLVPGAATKLKNLRNLHDAIDEAVMNSTSLDDMQKSLYQNALDRYRTDYAPRFKTGEASKIFENRARNMNGINDEDVAAALVKGPTEAKSFVAMIGDNPDALKKAQEGIEGIYRDKVIKDGIIDPAAHNAFMQKYGPQIDILDNAGMNLKDKLNSAAANTKTALSPINDVAEIRAAINQAPLPAGAKADEIASRAQALGSALPPDELEKALQIARRGQEYDRLAGSKISAPSEVPISKPIGFTSLEWGKRVFVEAMKKVGSKLSDKLTAQLAEQFTDPHQAADVIEQAIKYRAAQDARKASTTAAAAANTNVVNQLAPAGAVVNALAGQRQ